MNAMAFISGLVVGLMVGAFLGLVTMAVMVAGSDRDEHEIRRTGGRE